VKSLKENYRKMTESYNSLAIKEINFKNLSYFLPVDGGGVGVGGNLRGFQSELIRIPT
jgi:hypothetical protein